MNQPNVAKLYDDLHATENVFRKDSLYPIHKKMHFPESHIDDIYQWIGDQFPLPQSGHILDAGCGVGWGSHFLANNSRAKVTGITLSLAELRKAEQVLLHQQQVENLEFSQRSFDKLPTDSYDLIIAVESVKHSTDLAETMQSFHQALRVSGKLIIIEDIFNGQPSLLTQTLCQDWHLSKLYGLKDYSYNNPGMNLSVTDLSDRMVKKPFWQASLKLAFFNVLLKLNPQHNGWRAFRAGYCLDKLYQRNQMQYAALVFDKDNV